MTDPKSILGPTGKLDLSDYSYELVQRVQLTQKYDIDMVRGYLMGIANQMEGTTLSSLIRGEAFPDSPNEEQLHSIQILFNLLGRKYEEMDDLLDHIKNFKDTYDRCRDINTGPLRVLRMMAFAFMIAGIVISLFCMVKGWHTESYKFLIVAIGALFVDLFISGYMKRATNSKMKDLLEGKLLD